jgi:hypothetical protein
VVGEDGGGCFVLVVYTLGLYRLSFWRFGRWDALRGMKYVCLDWVGGFTCSSFSSFSPSSPLSTVAYLLL